MSSPRPKTQFQKPTCARINVCIPFRDVLPRLPRRERNTPAPPPTQAGIWFACHVSALKIFVEIGVVRYKRTVCGGDRTKVHHRFTSGRGFARRSTVDPQYGPRGAKTLKQRRESVAPYKIMRGIPHKMYERSRPMYFAIYLHGELYVLWRGRDDKRVDKERTRELTES